MKLKLNQFAIEKARFIFKTPDEIDGAGPARDISNDPEALVKQYKESLQSESPEEIAAATKAIDKYIESKASALVEKGGAPLVRAEIRKAADPSLDEVIDKVEARYEASDGGILNVTELKSMITIYSTAEERSLLEARAKEILDEDDLKSFNEHLAAIDAKLAETSYEANRDSFERTHTREDDRPVYERVNPNTLASSAAILGKSYNRPGGRGEAKYFSDADHNAVVDEDMGAIHRSVTKEMLDGFLEENSTIKDKLNNGKVDISRLSDEELTAYARFYGKVLSESKIEGNAVDGLLLPTEITRPGGLIEGQARGMATSNEDLARRSNLFIKALREGGYTGSITMKHWPGYTGVGNSDEEMVYGKVDQGTLEALKGVEGANSIMVSSLHLEDFGSNVGKDRADMLPVFADPEAIAKLREGHENMKVMTDDLSAYVNARVAQGDTRDRSEIVKETALKTLKAGVDQVMFADPKDQRTAESVVKSYMEDLQARAKEGDEAARTEYEARVKRMEAARGTAGEELSPEAKAWVDDVVARETAAKAEGRSLEGFGASEVAEADVPKEWTDSEATVADKEAITKLAEGLDAETQAEIKKLLEEGGEANLAKARELALVKQGEKLLSGKSGTEVLDIVEQNPDAAFNHFFQAEEGKENTWKVDFKGVDERLLGAGHFEKNLMAKFQYVKIFNPKTGETNIGVRGVKPGSEKPGYFDIHTGKYLPIWTGSVIKGLTAKDISEMDIKTQNAMRGEHGKPMSIKDYLAQAKEKRKSYRTSVENGTAQHQIGGENPLNAKLSKEAGREVVPEKQAKLRNAVGTLMRDKSRYKAVAQKHNVPWELLAAIQYREASGNLNKYFLNGQTVGTTTTIVPKGLRFDTWEASAEHAIVNRDHYGFKSLGTDPSPHAVANLTERYNGMGYSKRGLVSPYVWAGHPSYENQGGMFVSDGNFDRNAKDGRLGVMPIYMELRRQQGKEATS